MLFYTFIWIRPTSMSAVMLLSIHTSKIPQLRWPFQKYLYLREIIQTVRVVPIFYLFVFSIVFLEEEKHFSVLSGYLCVGHLYRVLSCFYICVLKKISLIEISIVMSTLTYMTCRRQTHKILNYFYHPKTKKKKTKIQHTAYSSYIHKHIYFWLHNPSLKFKCYYHQPSNKQTKWLYKNI